MRWRSGCLSIAFSEAWQEVIFAVSFSNDAPRMQSRLALSWKWVERGLNPIWLAKNQRSAQLDLIAQLQGGRGTIATPCAQLEAT